MEKKEVAVDSANTASPLKASTDATAGPQNMTSEKESLPGQKLQKNRFDENSKQFKDCVQELGAADCAVAMAESDETIELATKMIFDHEGERDTFWQCAWALKMAQRLGPEKARKIAQLHDTMSGEISKMPNYEYGVSAVDQFKVQIGSPCLDAFYAGKLVVTGPKAASLEIRPNGPAPAEVKPSTDGTPGPQNMPFGKESLPGQKLQKNQFDENSKQFKDCVQEFGAADCGIAKEESDRAIDIGDTLFFHQDSEREAFKQCEWAGQTAHKIGLEKARKIAQLHETAVNQNPNMVNYEHGVSVAGKSQASVQIGLACLDAISKVFLVPNFSISSTK